MSTAPTSVGIVPSTTNNLTPNGVPANIGISVEWGGGLKFDNNNDILLASGSLYTTQRVVRAILTNPQEVNSSSVVVFEADNLYDPTYGAGIGRDVNGVSDDNTRADRKKRIKASLSLDPTIDQTQPIDVEFMLDITTQTEYGVITYTDLSGDTQSIGIPT